MVDQSEVLGDWGVLVAWADWEGSAAWAALVAWADLGDSEDTEA